MRMPLSVSPENAAEERKRSKGLSIRRDWTVFQLAHRICPLRKGLGIYDSTI